MIDRETRYKAVVHYKHFTPSIRKVSKIYNVSKSSLHRWISLDPVAKKTRSRKSIQADVENAIVACIKENPFITVSGIGEFVSKSCNVRRSRSCVSNYMSRIGISRKKAFRSVNYSHDLGTVSRFCIDLLATEDVVCIDEAGFYLGDHGKYGYCRVGDRLRIMAGKSLRRSKLTLLLAISRRGIVGYKIMDHNCRKPDFVSFVNDLDVHPGSAIVMDNIPFHHSKETLDVLGRKQLTPIFTPPYSPRGNAIENVFGVLKTEYRSRCPPSPTEAFDYESLLLALLDSWASTDLSKYIDRTKAWARQTLADLTADPASISRFSGYG